MATRQGVRSEDSTGVTIVWSGLLNGDDGSPMDLPDCQDRSIQFEGTFGTNGSIQLEGSNDGANHRILTDPQGNNIVKTAAALEQVTELTKTVRPRVTGGDGSTALVATLYARRAR